MNNENINSDDEHLLNVRPSSAGIVLSRLLLTLYNAILILFGAILVVVGISLHNHLHFYMELVGKENINRGALVMIVAGIICCMTSIFSHYGAKHQSKVVLYITAFILFIIFIVEICAASGAVMYHSHIDTIFHTGINKTITDAAYDYENLKENQYMKTMTTVQQKLECCGSKDYNDWAIMNKNFETNQVPTSCCKSAICGEVINGIVQIENNNTNYIYVNGCYTQVVDFITENTTAVLICGYGLAVFQLIGLVFSCCLIKAISAANYEVYNNL